jgi:hypothetical protein
MSKIMSLKALAGRLVYSKMEDYFLTENIVQKNAITRNPYVLVGY